MIPIAAPDLGAEEQRRVREVIDSGYLVAGEEVAAFESAFADYCGADHGVATSNGTTALHTALRALGIGEGDRVVTTPFSFVATANAVRLCGAEPVFADVDPRTYNVDPDEVERIAAERDVDAILAVHLYGLPAAVDRLRAIADEHDLALIEDAAQAHGAEFDGQPVGSFGDAACFSFYPTKNLTTGEGGMVLTDREAVAERARRFVDHGRTGAHTYASVGHNFRLTNLAAAMGCIQLEKLDDYVEARREHAARLADAVPETVRAPVEPAGRRHAYNQFTVRCERRDRLREHLDARGVGTKVYYRTPIHEQPAFDGYDVSAPVAERLASEVVSVPVHPGLSEDDLATVAAALRSFEPSAPTAEPTGANPDHE
jgi:dTDP-4-amino-4,6-dideoxygalactose transaminase